MDNAVRTLLMSILPALILHGQALQAVDLQRIDSVCTFPEAEALGLACSEDDPCPVYLELSSVDGFGASIFVTGNLHTADTTMSALLLASDDSGKTWTEPAKRIRAAALEQIQFADAQHGWASGMLLDPLPRAPFILSTVNGGQTWNRTKLSSDRDFGSVQQFWFETSSRGQLIVDRSQGKIQRFELYTTTDGGETWAVKATSEEPMRLPNARGPEKANWRAVADKDSYRIERRTATEWETLARFPIRAGECK
jgi:photosystem II stability/assembly factor-like uncharacterized protein